MNFGTNLMTDGYMNYDKSRIKKKEDKRVKTNLQFELNIKIINFVFN